MFHYEFLATSVLRQNCVTLELTPAKGSPLREPKHEIFVMIFCKSNLYGQNGQKNKANHHQFAANHHAVRC
jgi:hypothetical protein